MDSTPPYPHPPAYPFCPWERRDGEIAIDWSVMGTAFFVSEEIFVTAAHVVEDYLYDDTPLRVLFLDMPERRMVPLKPNIVRHPSLDIAIGIVAPIPKELLPKYFVLGDGVLGAGERVLTYGYSHTKVEDRDGLVPGTLGLTVDWNPAFYEGEVDDFHPDGFGLAKAPVYVHTAETLGALSGAPMLRLADSAVYGVTCSGSQEYGTAVDVRAFLDWPISILDGRTLRSLASEGAVSMA
jgi:hypothetical protein